jgi:hypothetical protein
MCFASIRIYVSLRPLVTVLQIQIRIRKFLSLPDSEPSPLVGGMDPTTGPDPSIIKQK